MKKLLKKVLLIVVYFAVFIVFRGKVLAANPTYKTTVGSFPAELQHTFLSNDNSKTGLITYNDVSLFYKYTDKQKAATMCTNFAKKNSGNPDGYVSKACTPITGKNKWSSDPAVASGVAAIILQASGGAGNTLSVSKYHSAELAINSYLFDIKKYKTSYHRDFTKVGDTKALKNVGNAAKTAYTQFNKKSKLAVTLGKFNCNANHDCTASLKVSSGVSSKYNKNTNYQSNVTYQLKKVTIKPNNGSKVTLTENQYTYANNKLTIKSSAYQIPTVAGSYTWEVTVSFSASRKYYTAQEYSCGSNNQTVTPNIVKENTQTKNGSSKSSFKYTVNESGEKVKMLDCGINFYKVSSFDKEPLAGASITYNIVADGSTTQSGLTLSAYDSALADPDEEISSEASDVPYIGCVGLNISNYSLENITEENTPVGYKKFAPISSISYSGEEIDYYLENTPDNSITIKKIDGETSENLVGAEIVVYEGDDEIKWNYVDASGNVVNDPVAVEGYILAQVASDGSQSKWISQATPLKLMGLDYDTEYTVKEVKAPDTYIINYGVENVTLTNENDSTRNQTVTLSDFKTSVKISKQDITNGKEIAGAHLKVVDGQGNVYDEWDSTTSAHEINTLQDGSYYLIETIAPSGYELNETSIEFTVKNGKPQLNDEFTREVIMTNSPKKIPSPNTLLNKQIITYVLGLSLIIGGLGVLAYELKKKKVLSK